MKKFSLYCSVLFMLCFLQTSSATLPPSTARSDVATITTGPFLKNNNAMKINQNKQALIAFQKDNALQLAICPDQNCTSPSLIALDTLADTVQISLAVTPGGFAVIAYGSSTTNLKLLICNDLLCTAPVIKNFARNVEFLSLALSLNGVPTISFKSVGDALQSGLAIATCSNAQCSQSSIVQVTNDDSGAVDNSGDYNDIIIDSSGHPIISYNDHSQTELHIAICNDTVCSAPHIQPLDAFTQTGLFTSVALDSTNNIIISYTDATTSRLRMLRCSNDLCTNIHYSFIDEPGIYAHTSIAVSSNGFPIISYVDTEDFSLKVANCKDSTCFDPSIITLDSVLGQSPLTIDPLGTPVLNYITAGKLQLTTCNMCVSPEINIAASPNIDSDYFPLKTNQAGFPVFISHDSFDEALKITTCTDPACQNSITNVIQNTQSGTHASMEFNSNGFPIISFNGNSGLSLAICNNALCDNPTIKILSASNPGFYNSLKLKDDIPYVSHFDGDRGQLFLSFCSSVTCDVQITRITIDGSTEISVGAFSSLAFSLNNSPIISYYDVDNADLKIAVCSNSSCSGRQILTLDGEDAMVGEYSSIAVRQNGLPTISYYDSTNAELKIMYCDTSDCSFNLIQTIDSDGDVGKRSSLLLTQDDLPIISYEDSTSSKVKVAVCGQESCESNLIQPTIMRISNDISSGVANNALGINSQGFPTLAFIQEGTLKIAQFSPTNTLNLTVLSQGIGTGNIVSDIAGIDCGVKCEENYSPSTEITLTATPTNNSVFGYWIGDCSSSINQCTTTMSHNKNIQAIFAVPGTLFIDSFE